MATNDLTLLEIIRISLKWRKPILTVGITALIVSVVVALLMPNKYKSVSFFYAANSESQDTKNLFTFDGSSSGIFGSDDDVDRLLSIGNSNVLAFYIIQKFNLYAAYEIDSLTEPYHREYVLKEFQDNYSLIKNDLGALEVTVFDKDKNKASEMANEIVAEIDRLNQQVITSNNSKNKDIYQKRYTEKLNTLEALKDTMNKIRKAYGIFDPKTQNELLSEESSKTSNDLVTMKARLSILEKNYKQEDTAVVNTKAIIRGLEERTKSIAKNSGSDFNKGAALVSALEMEIEKKVEELSSAEELLQQAILATANNTSTIYVIEKAEPAVRKSKPVRSLIVLVSFVLSTFLAILFAVISETYGATFAQYLKNE